jgi:hypothetical protein
MSSSGNEGGVPHMNTNSDAAQRRSQIEEIDSDDLQEFAEHEERPLEQLLKLKGRNEFVFDPENGGGRRRRNKRVSRLELLNL